MKVAKLQKYVIPTFIVSFLAGIAANLLGYSFLAKCIGVPALLASFWVSLGHFVTLDDDMPGAWSNPSGSRKVWYSSILVLFVKIFVLLCVVFSIYV